jgi:hypothetical protein
MMQSLADIAGALAEEIEPYHGEDRGEERIPDYMIDEYGYLRGNPDDPIERAEALLETIDEPYGFYDDEEFDDLDEWD